MKQISDYYILSDMDGTLLGHDGAVPQRNIDALERFTRAGGRFGIATGRSRGLMLTRAQGLPINGPCVIYNGGALYDYENDKMLYEKFLPDAAEEYIQRIYRAFDDELGIMVISGDDYYNVSDEYAFSAFIETREKEHFRRSSLRELSPPWYKVLFQIEEKNFDRFFSLVEGMQLPGVRFVVSNLTLIEMLPEGVSKGATLQRLLDSGYVKQENLVAIGDYYNDLEMIELAGIGVTLESSPEDIKAKADIIVGDCSDGAVADLIEHLERTVEQQ